MIASYYQSGMLVIGSPPSAYPDTAITKTALRKRFTVPERVAISTAAMSSGTLQMLADDLLAATYVDLALPDLGQALQVYVDAGLLTADRRLEIMSAPIQDAERPL